jgi:acetolactate synthase I/II/III large subunit
MKSAELFVKALEQEGTSWIFGVPGEENLDLLEAISASKIRFITTRHEQTAGFMAATCGRLTGNTGVCLATLGPGATNLVTAAAYAQLGAMPMLMITGQKAIRDRKQGKFQILDVIDMMRPLTKYTRQIADPDNVSYRVRQAFRIAEEERPGAVHLELPEDVAAEQTDEVPFIRSTVRRPIADDVAIQNAVELIEKSQRPLLLVGAGANRKQTSVMLSRFVDEHGIYFFDTQMGKGVLDSRHPNYLGNAALSQHDYVHCAIRRADLIINVGHDVVEKPPFFMERGGVKVIHINFLSASVDPVYFPQVEVVGDISNSIRLILAKLKKQAHWDSSYFKRICGELKKDLKLGADADRYPVIPQRLVADVRKAMPEDGIVALDNGIFKIWFARNYPAYSRNTLLLDNALATMGAGLSGAMAANIVYPERKVLAVCGDGGFMMNSQELETAVRIGLNVTVLVLRDDAYGMIRWKQQAEGYKDFGLTFGNPDFVRYAECYGAKGVRIQKTDEFLPVLKKCLDSKGVDLIELPVDYSENQRVLTHEMKQRTCVL